MEYHDKMTRHAPALGGEATTRVSERPDPFLELNPLFHHTSDGVTISTLHVTSV